METRKSSRKKRKTGEDAKMEQLQGQFLEPDNQQEKLNIRSRDIVVDKDIVSVKQEDVIVKQEPETELQVDTKLNILTVDMKLEIEDQKVVVVTEEEILCCSGYGDNGVCPDEHNCKVHLKLSEISIYKSEPIENPVLCIEQSLPHILEHLGVNSILLCREVSKNWRLVVDNFLETKTIEEPYDNDAYLRTMQRYPVEQMLQQKYKKIKYSYCFEKYQPSRHERTILYKFMDKMRKYQDSALSPFIGGGRVTLAQYLFDDNNSDRELADEFLKKFGTHIRYLKIKEERDLPFNQNTDDFVEDILKYLRYTPNLKQLTVRLKKFRYQTFRIQRRGPHKVPKAESFCLTCIQFKKPGGLELPPKLESFCLSVTQGFLVPNLHKMFSTDIIKPYYEGQLQKLALNWPNNLSLKMSALKELTLTFGHEVGNCYGPYKYPSLDLFRSDDFFGARIEKLHLKTYTKQNIQMADLLKLIGMLPSVQYLKLSYLIWASIAFENSGHLSYTNNIHTLELTNFYGKSGVPIELFRSFPKLRYFTQRIIWVPSYGIMESKDPATNLFPQNLFLGSRNSFYKTQLWEILPSLDMVAIEFHKHKCNISAAHPCGEYPFCKRWSTKECRIENIVATRKGYRKHVGNAS